MPTNKNFPGRLPSDSRNLVTVSVKKLVTVSPSKGKASNANPNSTACPSKHNVLDKKHNDKNTSVTCIPSKTDVAHTDCDEDKPTVSTSKASVMDKSSHDDDPNVSPSKLNVVHRNRNDDDPSSSPSKSRVVSYINDDNPTIGPSKGEVDAQRNGKTCTTPDAAAVAASHIVRDELPTPLSDDSGHGADMDDLIPEIQHLDDAIASADAENDNTRFPPPPPFLPIETNVYIRNPIPKTAEETSSTRPNAHGVDENRTSIVDREPTEKRSQSLTGRKSERTKSGRSNSSWLASSNIKVRKSIKKIFSLRRKGAKQSFEDRATDDHVYPNEGHTAKPNDRTFRHETQEKPAMTRWVTFRQKLNSELIKKNLDVSRVGRYEKTKVYTVDPEISRFAKSNAERDQFSRRPRDAFLDSNTYVSVGIPRVHRSNVRPYTLQRIDHDYDRERDFNRNLWQECEGFWEPDEFVKVSLRQGPAVRTFKPIILRLDNSGDSATEHGADGDNGDVRGGNYADVHL